MRAPDLSTAFDAALAEMGYPSMRHERVSADEGMSHFTRATAPPLDVALKACEVVGADEVRVLFAYLDAGVITLQQCEAAYEALDQDDA